MLLFKASVFLLLGALVLSTNGAYYPTADVYLSDNDYDVTNSTNTTFSSIDYTDTTEDNEILASTPTTDDILETTTETVPAKEDCPLEKLVAKIQAIGKEISAVKENVDTTDVHITAVSGTANDLKEEFDRNKIDYKIADLLRNPRAKLYRVQGHRGTEENYDSANSTYEGGCTKLTTLMANVKSVDSLDTCVRLFEKSMCSGPSVAVYPKNGYGSMVLGPKLSSVSYVGPCLKQEFKFATLVNDSVLKDFNNTRTFPDLLDLTGFEKSAKASSISSTTNSVIRYVQGVKGRVEYVSAKISKRHLATSEPFKSLAGNAAWDALDKEEGDRVGRLIPVSLGGPETEAYNVFPQSLSGFRDWSKQAVKVASYLKEKPTHHVTARVNVLYESEEATRPLYFVYWFNFGGEKVSYGLIWN